MIFVQELLYLEVPTADTPAVRSWLREVYAPPFPKQGTANGCIIHCPEQLSIFAWSWQRTTYVKGFWWSTAPVPKAVAGLLSELSAQLRSQFPITYPEPPTIAKGENIFDALAAQYPLTVKFFQRFPKGEYDLQRVYWWEQRWRQSVRTPEHPQQVLFQHDRAYGDDAPVAYDLLYLGGALGAIHGAMMAKLGYRVGLVERLGFGRMNREWNISRAELDNLVQFGLFTWQELEPVITAEYEDGFNKFFDGNNPPHLKSPVLHTPRVLNVALDTSKLLALCGQKLAAVSYTHLTLPTKA
jgi:lycopene cyclase CruA